MSLAPWPTTIDQSKLRNLAQQLAIDALSFDVDAIVERWSRLLLNPQAMSGLITAMCARIPR